MEESQSLFTCIPFERPSQIYRSMMPNHRTIKEFSNSLKVNNIGIIVLLCTPEECKKFFPKKKGIEKFYTDRNIEVIPFPIKDFSIPALEGLTELARAIKQKAQGEEKNILIHCRGGTGRTGLILACLALEFFPEKSPDEAIGWVRNYINGAVETEEQKGMVSEYAEKMKKENKVEVSRSWYGNLYMRLFSWLH